MGDIHCSIDTQGRFSYTRNSHQASGRYSPRKPQFVTFRGIHFQERIQNKIYSNPIPVTV